MLEMMSLVSQTYTLDTFKGLTKEILMRRVGDHRHYSKHTRLYYAMLLTAYGL